MPWESSRSSKASRVKRAECESVQFVEVEFAAPAVPRLVILQPVEKPFPSQCLWINWGMFEERDAKTPKQGEFWMARDRLPAATAGSFYRKLDETLETIVSVKPTAA